MSEKSVSENEPAPLPSSNYEEKLTLWRKERFLHMGFDDDWALALAEAKVDHNRVHWMLRNGCSHTLACSIML